MPGTCKDPVLGSNCVLVMEQEHIFAWGSISETIMTVDSWY